MTITPEPDALFRAHHVGGSEVSALFGCNPWLTEFELWHRKAGNIATPEFNAVADDGTPDNERIYWGVRLEPLIIEGAKERYGYTDRPPADPPMSNGKGLGGHPDRRVICPERGNGVIETKMVDWLVRKQWGDEPPLHYLLQGNTYAGLDGCLWFDLIVLVGGNRLERFQYDFRPKLHAEAERRTVAFWQSLADNRPPKPDYSRDLGPIKELYAEQGEETADLQGDNRAAIAAAEYLVAAEEAKAANARKDAAQAELIDKMKDAAFAFLDGFHVRATLVKASEYTVARKAYRRLTVKELED